MPVIAEHLVQRHAAGAVGDRSGGGLRGFRNALVLVAPDRELWARAEDAMKEVMAYEQVMASVEKKTIEVSQAEERDLRSRLNDKRESLRTSVSTAYRWLFYPDANGLEVTSLQVPATRNERIASRAVARLADENLGQPKVLPKMGAVYFDSKLAPSLWKDQGTPLDLGEMSRRFPIRINFTLGKY